MGNAQGWSSAPGDESDNEEQFLPMDLGINGMSDSISTNNNISMEGSISGSSVSSKGSTTNYPKHHKHRPSAETDPTAETSQFHVRVSSITFVLLHEDILTVSIEGRHLTSASTEQMKLAAEEFFQKLGLFAADGYGNRNIDKVSKVFADACRYSHIRYAIYLFFIGEKFIKIFTYCFTYFSDFSQHRWYSREAKKQQPKHPRQRLL